MKIGKKAKEGKIELVAGMYLLIFLLLIFTMQTRLGFFSIAGTVMEDALAASNLASAVVDVREYGLSHTVQIASPDTAYCLYREALKQNLSLNDNWEYGNPDLIHGPVRILQYIIYNVKKDDILIYAYDEVGNCHFWTETGGLGRIYTPDGTRVESTSIYSKVRFSVEVLFGISMDAEKEKTVDIVSKEN